MEIPKFKPLAEGSEKSKNIFKYVLGAALVILTGALGLELTNNDYDLGKLAKGSTWKEAKVKRDKEGNVVTDGSGKYTNDYNCKDFDTQPEAQKFFDKVKADTGKDPNRLDGNKDNIPCQHLKKGEKKDTEKVLENIIETVTE